MTNAQHKQLIIAALLFVCNFPVSLPTAAEESERKRIKCQHVHRNSDRESVCVQTLLHRNSRCLQIIVSEHCGRFDERQTYFWVFSPHAGAKPLIAPFVLFTVHQPYSLCPLNSPKVSKCGHNSQLVLLSKSWDFLSWCISLLLWKGR